VDANETEIGTKSGSSDTRDAAMAAAKRAIDNALDPKKRKLLPPSVKTQSWIFSIAFGGSGLRLASYVEGGPLGTLSRLICHQ
jgi:hypothetical protein